jgi:hypothetical protein
MGVITRCVQRCWIDRTRTVNHVATHAIYRCRGRMGVVVHHDQLLHLPTAAKVVVAPTTLARDSARGRSPAEDRYNAVEWTMRVKNDGARDLACRPGANDSPSLDPSPLPSRTTVPRRRSKVKSRPCDWICEPKQTMAHATLGLGAARSGRRCWSSLVVGHNEFGMD